jgi:signal transduction histidine kinase
VVCDPELCSARFETAAEIAAYRVAQEATTNALKHSGASQVNIKLRYSANALHLVVSDNGRGFKDHGPTQDGSPTEGLGLSGMRERVVLLGGRFSIRSEAGAGVTVEAAIPAGPQAT